MWPTVLQVNDPFSTHLLRLAGVVLVALAFGWTAARILDPGVRARGLTLLAGLLGLTGGTWLAGQAGWEAGPVILGYAVLPSFAGSLTTCAVVKLLALGVTGSR